MGQVDGVLASVALTEGAVVCKWQVVARIDDRALRAQLALIQSLGGDW